MNSISHLLGRQQAALEKAAAGCRSPRCFALVAVACFVAAAAPLLGWYWQRVTDGSDEPLGVLALLTAGGLVMVSSFRQEDRTKLTVHPMRMLAGALLLAVIQGTACAHFPLLSGLLAVMILGVSVARLGGKPGLLALLVLSLPLVASLDFYVGYPLRLAAAHLAVFLLNLGGLGVERAGVLMLDGGNLVGMDPPCAGVRMLWTACFTAAVMAAQRRFLWMRTGLLVTGAVVCVVLGNSVRAALVFFPESGRVQWPHWMHPGVGLVVHGVVLALVFSLGNWLSRKRLWKAWWKIEKGKGFIESGRLVSRRSRTARFGWLAVSGIAAVGMLALWPKLDEGNLPCGLQGAASWPATLDGAPLVPVPLSSREARFAQAFPGRIAKFRCGDAEVIFRHVAAATRFMHPSGDCLRAAGFEVTSKPVQEDADGRLWGCSIAERAGEAWRVRERYVNGGQTRVCTDASAWFWEAVFHSGEGPWTAVTVMERMDGGKLAAR